MSCKNVTKRAQHDIKDKDWVNVLLILHYLSMVIDIPVTLLVFIDMIFFIIFLFGPLGNRNDTWKTGTFSYVVWIMVNKIPWRKLVPHMLCGKNNDMCLGLTAWKLWLFLWLLDTSCMFHSYDTSLMTLEGNNGQ